MKGIYHPLTRALYERDADANVFVTGSDGRQGRFTAKGIWLDGQLRDCDPQLCAWVVGPQIPHHRIAEAHHNVP